MKIVNLKKQDFEEILNNYNIGKYKYSKHIWWALQNTVYFLNTTKGKFVLKVFDKSDLKFINYQIKIMEFLEKRKFPIQKIIKIKNKRDLFIYKKKYIVIYKFIEGREPKKFNNQLIKDSSRILGLLNKNLLRVKLQGKYIWEKDYQFKPMKERAEIIGKFDFDKEEKKILKEFKKIKRNKVRKSVTHGDFHSPNFLVKKNKITAIIDWDDMHEDFLPAEIGVFIAHTFIDKKEVKINQLKLFFKEYKKYIKLNQEEMKFLYYSIKNRYLASISWCENQRKTHKDKNKEIKKWTLDLIKRYRNFDKILLNKFLLWIK